MTDRELSQELFRLACQVDVIAELSEGELVPSLYNISDRLKELSNEKYTPGHTSWEDVKKVANSNKKTYRDSRGRTLPF